MKRLALVAFIPCLAFTVWCASCPAERAAAEQRVVLDCSCTRVLADFDKARACEALLRHLCASAEWRVTAHAEVTPDNKVKRVIQAQYPAKHQRTFGELMGDGNHQVHVTVRFDSSLPNNRERGIYVLAKAGSRGVEMLLSAAPDSSRTLGSTLMIEGASLVLEINEYSSGRDRALTKNMLHRIAEEFSAVRDNIEEIERKGYLQKYLPNGSLRESAEQLPLEILEGFTRGMYWVRGYVNPQEKGYITIRTFHARTGKELEADVNSWRTVQYVGWSSRPKQKFLFECELAAPSYLTEEQSKMDSSDPRRFQAMAAEQDIRVEVWFHGKAERKLLEATKILVPWMR